MNQTFAQKWQAISFDQALLSWCIAQHMGLNFYDSKTAHEWRMLRRDYRFFYENEDYQMSDWCLEQIDELIERDEQKRMVADSFLAKMRQKAQGQAGYMEVAS